MVEKRATILTQPDREAVAAAIRKAETSTSGEILCILCRRSDDYFHAAGFTMAIAVLIAGVALSWIAHAYWVLLDPRFFALALAGAFVLGLVLIGVFPTLRMFFVPKRIRYRRAHAHALAQFVSHDLAATRDRTGVLIFLSLAERYAAVLADEAIDTKVSQDDWNATVASLIDGASRGEIGSGFVAAVGRAGMLLERHFPPRPDDINELPDRIVEI